MMASSKSNIGNIKIGIEQCLSKLRHANKVHKKLINLEKESLMYLVQCNNLNLLCGLVIDILRNRNPGNFYNSIREKKIQPATHEFATKKGNFSGRVARNLCACKVVDYLVDKMN